MQQLERKKRKEYKKISFVIVAPQAARSTQGDEKPVNKNIFSTPLGPHCLLIQPLKNRATRNISLLFLCVTIFVREQCKDKKKTNTHTKLRRQRQACAKREEKKNEHRP